MATIAILDDVLPLQLLERPGELDPVRVVWTGTDRAALRSAASALRPNVLALDIDRLGDEPIDEARRLADASGAEMVLLLYQFAPREMLRDASRVGARPVKTPIRLGALRTQMTSVIVRNILNDERSTTPVPVPSAPKTAPAPTLAPPRRGTPASGPLGPSDPDVPGRRFTRAQLGRLAEIQSSIECECPNHLSELLIALGAFEDYSRACRNRDDADARIHTMLYRNAARARSIVENALAELLVHERITL
ncbi:MAG: hypothetical protein M3Y87_33385 [Myxococcota bacterium]|nr:hypothetical protein [Myxococcota bacterium]